MSGDRSAESDREVEQPPYWRDAAWSFLRVLAGFALASLLAVILSLAYYGVVA